VAAASYGLAASKGRWNAGLSTNALASVTREAPVQLPAFGQVARESRRSDRPCTIPSKSLQSYLRATTHTRALPGARRLRHVDAGSPTRRYRLQAMKVTPNTVKKRFIMLRSSPLHRSEGIAGQRTARLLPVPRVRCLKK
jgi:hypothetical protein